ncbi:hypothetical protein [Tropicibacter sp. S64]|uniref:hypothetical protein n=1 Tax=Tropicibacter sp. S64 TaxID=3415122 RepID=UPI003C7A678C
MTPLTLPQRECLVLAAEYLAREIPGGMEPSAFGASLLPLSPVFDIGACALARLGIFEEGPRNGVYAVAITPDRVRAHLARRALSAADFGAALQAWLNHAAGHAQTLPDTRASFVLPDLHARIGTVLMRLGLLEADGGRVRWTQKAAPYMQEAILWDDKGQCLSEIWQAQEEAEARNFFAGLPAGLVQALRRTVIEKGGFEGLDFLRHHWTEHGWTEIRQENPGNLSDAEFRVNFFTTFIRLIREGRG